MLYMKDFDAKKEVNNIINFIRDYYNKNNLGGVILGISGGKDSAVVAGLFSLALGSENVIGVTMPCHSRSSDKSDAKIVSDHFGFELINFDLTNVYNSFKNELTNLGDFDSDTTKNIDINLKPRMRMSTLYYLAAMYSSIRGKTYLVAGTSNRCEIFVGYFTKGGDNVCDIAVIADYTVEEVIKIGEYIGVPLKVLYKTPDDGLSNLSDEDKLGVKYSEIAAYERDVNSVPSEIAQKIKKLHDGSLHKKNIPTYRRK